MHRDKAKAWRKAARDYVDEDKIGSVRKRAEAEADALAEKILAEGCAQLVEAEFAPEIEIVKAWAQDDVDKRSLDVVIKAWKNMPEIVRDKLFGDNFKYVTDLEWLASVVDDRHLPKRIGVNR